MSANCTVEITPAPVHTIEVQGAQVQMVAITADTVFYRIETSAGMEIYGSFFGMDIWDNTNTTWTPTFTTEGGNATAETWAYPGGKHAFRLYAGTIAATVWLNITDPATSERAVVEVKVEPGEPDHVHIVAPENVEIRDPPVPVKIVARVYDAFGNPVQSELAWTVSDPSLARLENGTLTPLSVGKVVVSATATAGRATASVTVYIYRAVSPEVSQYKTVYDTATENATAHILAFFTQPMDPLSTPVITTHPPTSGSQITHTWTTPTVLLIDLPLTSFWEKNTTYVNLTLSGATSEQGTPMTPWNATINIPPPPTARTETQNQPLPASPKEDTDGDGMPDWWETASGLNPGDPGDASGDLDGDGLTNKEEWEKKTDPLSVDTDGDGVLDSRDAYPLDPTAFRRPVTQREVILFIFFIVAVFAAVAASLHTFNRRGRR